MSEIAVGTISYFPSGKLKFFSTYNIYLYLYTYYLSEPKSCPALFSRKN